MIHRNKYKGLVIRQTEKIDKLKHADTQYMFNSQRGLFQYVGVNVRPHSCAPIQLIAPGNQPTTDEEYKLTRSIKFLQQAKTQGLNFVKLNISTIRLVLIKDSSFGNALGLKSPLGYVTLIVDGEDRCNIVHYGINR